MSAPRNLKSAVLEMRHNGLSYRQIQKELSCSRGSINYICKKHDMLDTGKKVYPLTKELKEQILEFCKTHTNPQAVTHFGVSLSSVKKYKKNQE